MEIKLSQKKKIQLEVQHKTERDKYICDRIKAVLLRSEHWSIADIAQALRIHKDTVARHLQEYLAIEKLSPCNGGSHEKLDEKQAEELIAHLEKTTYQNVAAICAYVETTYQIHYTVAGMTFWLHAHQFSYKKPKEIPAKADKQKQQEFIQAYIELKKKVGKKWPILFIDSVHPTMETKASYGWIRTGKEKPILTTASRTRLNITGAICLNTMQVEYQHYDTINGETTIDFLKQIKSVYPTAKQIHMILDCSGYHRSKEVRKFAENNHIKLHFLPAYSPNLNPIEQLWKVMNEKVRNNQFFSSAKAFRDAVLGFFKTILPEIKSSLASRINDNFHLLDAASSI